MLQFMSQSSSLSYFFKFSYILPILKDSLIYYVRNEQEKMIFFYKEKNLNLRKIFLRLRKYFPKIRNQKFFS